MLVLTRGVGSVVRIGEDVTVKLLEIKGQKAVLGIDAPRNLAVDRAEVRRDIEKNGRRKRKS